MARARIVSATLLNWRGVFYQRYELDPRVTALEGKNGAGKTTVMIALYVALLPDMSLLRFEGAGDGEQSSQDDRGIYGRLGEEGLSYTVLELEAPDGERLLAGVQLRRAKAPTVEVETFIIQGLAPETPLQPLLLLRQGEDERVPTLPELADSALRLGGQLTHFKAPGDYFSTLFAAGILPLPMDHRRDRGKLNKMLQTSMSGGLSSSIQRSLRDYLLAPDTGLRSHVGQMRENLKACRSTRQEVERTHQTFETVSRVYASGYGMLKAAFHGTRLRAREQGEIARSRRIAHKEAVARARSTQDAYEEAREEKAQSTRALEGAAEAYREVQEEAQRVRAAVKLRRQIEELEVERLSLKQAFDLRRGQVSAAESAHEGAREREALAQEHLARAQVERGDLQAAYEGLAKRAGAHRAAKAALHRAQASLPERTLTGEGIDDQIADVDRSVKAERDAFLEAQGALASEERRAERYHQVLRALTALHGSPIPPADVLEIRGSAMADLSSRRDRAERQSALEEEQRRALSLADQQDRIRRDAATLAEEGRTIDSSHALGEAHRETEEALDARREAREELRGRLKDLERQIPADERRLLDLRQLHGRWEAHRRRAQRLASALGAPLEESHQLREVSRTLDRHLRDLDRRIEEQGVERQALEKELKALRERGGALDARLPGLRDHLGGELLVDRFEHVDLEEAPEIEARLGPLLGAIVVEDVAAAARAAAGQERPDTLWLLGGGDDKTLPLGETIADAVLIPTGGAHRLTRLPTTPVVGAAARQRRIAQVERSIRDVQGRLETLRGEREEVQGHLDEVEALLPDADLLDLTDPAPAMAALEAQLREARGEARKGQATFSDIERRLKASEARRRALSALLKDAHFLDAPEWRPRAARLREEVRRAQEDRAFLAHHSQALATLERGYRDLESPPLSDDERAALRGQEEARRAELERLSAGLDALRSLQPIVDALAYVEAEDRLHSKESQLTHLTERISALQDTLEERQAATKAADLALQGARGEANQADAQLKAKETLLEEREAARAALNVDDSDAALETIEAMAQEVRAALTAAERRKDGAIADESAKEVTATSAAEAEGVAHRERDAALKALRPHHLALIHLRLQLGRSLLAELQSPEDVSEYDKKGGANCWAEAKAQASSLEAILHGHEEGGDLLAGLRRLLTGPEEEGRRGLVYLRAWEATARWLEDRLPRDIVTADAPLEALKQLKAHLERLEHRLKDQELALRQSSESIANGLLSRLRREEGRIRQLNKRLSQTTFGSVQSIRIQSEREARMGQLLHALKEQVDLFHKGMDIEEAMAELYQQQGGGQIRGDRLLDYREYLRLRVEIQRQGGERWERASSSSLSTGESIGVGASVLMVILMAWEQEADLLGRRSNARRDSLRFLFLDEATRLDSDSLSTVLELCDRLEMQLLIAAPAVDQARRGLTYRLVRRFEPGGGQRVLVRGRRGFLDEERAS